MINTKIIIFGGLIALIAITSPLWMDGKDDSLETSKKSDIKVSNQKKWVDNKKEYIDKKHQKKEVLDTKTTPINKRISTVEMIPETEYAVMGVDDRKKLSKEERLDKLNLLLSDWKEMSRKEKKPLRKMLLSQWADIPVEERTIIRKVWFPKKENRANREDLRSKQKERRFNFRERGMDH